MALVICPDCKNLEDHKDGCSCRTCNKIFNLRFDEMQERLASARAKGRCVHCLDLFVSGGDACVVNDMTCVRCPWCGRCKRCGDEVGSRFQLKGRSGDAR